MPFQAHLSSSTVTLSEAMARVVATLQGVIGRTAARGGGELRLVQSKDIIEHPSTSGFKPESIDPGLLSAALVFEMPSFCAGGGILTSTSRMIGHRRRRDTTRQ